MQQTTIPMPRVLGFLSGALGTLQFVDITCLMITPENPIQSLAEMPHDALHFTHKETGERAVIFVRYDNYRFDSRLLDPATTLLNMVKWIKALELIYPEYKLEKSYYKHNNNYYWRPGTENYRIFDTTSDSVYYGGGLTFGNELKNSDGAEEEDYRLMAEYMFFAMATAAGITPSSDTVWGQDSYLRTDNGSSYRLALNLQDGLTFRASPEDFGPDVAYYHRPSPRGVDLASGYIILFGKPHHFRFSSRLFTTSQTFITLVPRPLLEAAAKAKLKELFPFVWYANDEKLDFVWTQKQN